MFQHTAARRRLHEHLFLSGAGKWFQHTAARRRLPLFWKSSAYSPLVSTHSRPKAAASNFSTIFSGMKFQHTAARRRLPQFLPCAQHGFVFQHTAARRRLLHLGQASHNVKEVSTHSRPKAAAWNTAGESTLIQFQHTAARRRLLRA